MSQFPFLCTFATTNLPFLPGVCHLTQKYANRHESKLSGINRSSNIVAFEYTAKAMCPLKELKGTRSFFKRNYRTNTLTSSFLMDFVCHLTPESQLKKAATKAKKDEIRQKTLRDKWKCESNKPWLCLHCLMSYDHAVTKRIPFPKCSVCHLTPDSYAYWHSNHATMSLNK